MKKVLLILITALIIFGLCSCDPYADQFNKMQSEINSLKERVERNEESIDILIANTDTEVARLRDYIDSVSIISDGQNEEVLEKIESLKTILDALKKNTNDSDKDRIAEIEALEEDLATLETKVTSLNTRVTTLEDISATLSDIRTITDRLDAMDVEDKDRDICISSLSNGIIGLNKIIKENYDELKSASSEHDLVLSSLSDEVDELKESLTTLVATVDNGDSTLLDRLRKLEGEVSLMDISVKSLKDKMTNLTEVVSVNKKDYTDGNKELSDSLETVKNWLEALTSVDGYHVKVDERTGEVIGIEKHKLAYEGGTEDCCRKVYCSECGYVESNRTYHGYDTNPLVSNFTGKNIKIERTEKVAAGSYWVWRFPQFTYLYCFYCPECGLIRDYSPMEYDPCDFDMKSAYNASFNEDEWGYWGYGEITNSTSKVYRLEDSRTWTTIYVECPYEVDGSNVIEGEVVAVVYLNRVWVAKDNNGKWLDDNHTLHLLNKTATAVEEVVGRYAISNLNGKLINPEKVTCVVEEGSKIIIL